MTESTALTLDTFDVSKAEREDAPAGEKILGGLIPLYRDMQEKLAKYRASTDTDEAVKAYITSPTEDAHKELAEQIRQAKALIKKNEAVLNSEALAIVKKNIDPNFDEGKAKAAANDSKVALRKQINELKPAVQMFGWIKPEKVTEAGRESDFSGTNDIGRIFLEIADSIPRKVDPKTESDNDSPEAVAKREVRKAAKDWGKANGKEVADRGALSTDLLKEYLDTNAADKAKWEKANK